AGFPDLIEPRRAWSRSLRDLLPFLALRCALPCFLLQAGDKRAQRCRARRSLARWARRRGGGRQARVDFGEAPVRLDVLAPRDDAIGERDVRLAGTNLSHVEALGHPSTDIEPAAIAGGHEKNPIVAGRHHFCEVGIEPEHGAPPLELRRTQ